MDRSLGDDRIEWKAAGSGQKSSWPLIIGVVWLAAGLGVLYSYGAPYFSPARPGAVARVEPAPAEPSVTAPAPVPTEPEAKSAAAPASPPNSANQAAGIAAEAAKDPIATVIINDQAKRDEQAKEDKAAAKQAKSDESGASDTRASAKSAAPRAAESKAAASKAPDQNSAATERPPAKIERPARTARIEAPPSAATAGRDTAPIAADRDRAPSSTSSGGDFRSLRESVLRDALETPSR